MKTSRIISRRKLFTPQKGKFTSLGRAGSSPAAAVSLPSIADGTYVFATGSIKTAGYSGPLFDYNRESDAVTGSLSDVKRATVTALETGTPGVMANRLRISKSYDHIGTNHGIQATISSMPVLPSVAAYNGIVPVVFQNDETNAAVHKWFDYASMGLDRTNHFMFMVIDCRSSDDTTEFFEHANAGTAQMAVYNVGPSNGFATRGVAQKFSLKLCRSQPAVVGYVSGTTNITHYSQETSRTQATSETSVTMGAAIEGKSSQAALLSAKYYGRHGRFYIVAGSGTPSDASCQLIMAELRRAFAIETTFTGRYIQGLDSNSEGFCRRSIHNMFQQLTFRSGIERFNMSVTGQTEAGAGTSKFTALWKTTIPILFVNQGGTNDIFVSLSTAATVDGLDATLNTAMHGAGANVKTCVLTLPPRVSNVQPGESERLSLNSLRMANANGYDYTVDLASFFSYADLADTAKFAPDKIHLTSVSDGVVVAGGLQTIVNTVLV